ncbi:heavy-metal-associated domain-containing protein [Luxibacter massiliensis]|uniref:heavy-metal-associated domain-containing protein n=1 Tax=Luxibacter massiliensis TaxID=2219695 RepID=UPI000F04A9A0|nr:heavy metal-associated domain-containing protein [Luxibacter massiliensis]
MATGIICVVIILICVLGVRSYAKKLTQGCCGGGDAVKKVKPKDKNTAHYPYISKVQIEGMTCTNCGQRIENAFNSMEGVWAKVDSQAGNGTIRMKQRLKEEELKKVVERLGYTAVNVEYL